MNLLIRFLPHLWINRLSHQVGKLSHSTHLFSKNRLGNCQLENVVWYIFILCSFSDAAAGSLRVWLFIYQDQGWTSPDLVCLGATLLLTLLHLILPGRYITINITLHYFPGHYITTLLPGHYITLLTSLHYLFAQALHYLQLLGGDCSELLTTGVGENHQQI